MMSGDQSHIAVETNEANHHLSELAQKLMAKEVELILRELERKYECISRAVEANHGDEIKDYIEDLKQKYIATHTALVQELMSQEIELISKELEQTYKQTCTFEESKDNEENQVTKTDLKQEKRSSSSSVESESPSLNGETSTERELNFLHVGTGKSDVQDSDESPTGNALFVSKSIVRSEGFVEKGLAASDHVDREIQELEGVTIPPHHLATREILAAFNELDGKYEEIKTMAISTESEIAKRFSIAWQQIEKVTKDLEPKFEERVEEIKNEHDQKNCTPLHKLEEGQSISPTSLLSSSEVTEHSNNDNSKRNLDFLTGLGNSKHGEDEEVQDDKEAILYLDKDTYTMMMISSMELSLTKCLCLCCMPCACVLMLRGSSWVFGLIPPTIQLLLCSIIVSDQTHLDIFVWLENGQFPGSLNIPAEKQSNAVYIGQFFAITLALMTQSDVLSATQTFLLLRNSPQVPWQRTISRDGMEENIMGIGCFTWLVRVFIPVFLKFIQGLFVLFISWLLIVQSTNVVDLLKDYTALFVISSIDDIFYFVAARGYLGNQLAACAEEAKCVQIYTSTSTSTNDVDTSTSANTSTCTGTNHDCSIGVGTAQSVLFFCMLFGMLGGWVGTMVGQIQGKTGNSFVYKAS